MKPLCIDLFCGLGGWTEGFLAEQYDVIGFDIERHVYGAHRYPAQLVLQDVRTLHGSQFKDAAMIVASSPCQEFSYRAMPWKRAKALGPPLLGMELFAQAARIQKEASEAAGHHIPMIQENVRGAQKYVGRAQWHYGSYYLWGDVPALMPFTTQRVMKEGVAHRSNGETNFHGSAARAREDGTKHGGKHGVMSGWGHDDGIKAGDRCVDRATGKWSVGWNVQNVRNLKAAGPAAKPEHQERRLSEDEGLKCGGDWFGPGVKSTMRQHSSKSTARKAASAAIAKIPAPLARWIAQCYKPA